MQSAKQNPFAIVKASCAYGKVASDGTLGYPTDLTDRVIHPLLSADTPLISAHAPSLVELETTECVEVIGFMNATANVGDPVVFYADDNPLGVLSGPLEHTLPIYLRPGKHTLKTVTSHESCRHSVWSLKPVAPRAPSRLAVVTIACYPELEAWRQIWHLSRSVLLKGMCMNVMGIGTEYRSHADAKIHRLRDFISSIDSEYILFTDGKDSIVIGDEDEIVSEFEKMGTDFVISMERECHPIRNHGGWASAFPAKVDGRNYPNAGGWMGTKTGVLRVLDLCKEFSLALATGVSAWRGGSMDAILRPMVQDDQAMLQVQYLSDEFVGDTECRIFTNFGTANWRIEDGDYHLESGRLVLKSTGRNPLVIHFSGWACQGARDQWAALLGVY